MLLATFVVELNMRQQTLHINVRELYVVFICDTTFCLNVTELHLKFELDNNCNNDSLYQ